MCIIEKMSEKEKNIFDKYKHDIPFKLVSFAEELNIDIFLDSALEDFLSGFIKYENNKYTIIINAKHSAVRQRFTTAHELGHYFYDKDYLNNNHKIEDITVQKLYRADNNFQKTNADMITRDIRANKFAAELLVPEEKFINLYREIGSEHTNQLANIFNVSEAVIKIRANEIFGEILY